jgi:hypothetical protein
VRAQDASKPPVTGPLKVGPNGRLAISDERVRDILPGRVKLTYRLGPRTAGCEKEAKFRAWVESDLGLDPFVPTGEPSHELLVAIERADGDFSGSIELRDAAGRVLLRERPMERTCRDIMDKLVVITLVTMFWPEPKQKEESCENACTKKLQEEIDELRAKYEELRERNEREALARQKERRRLEERIEELEARSRAMQDELKKRTVAAMDLAGALSTSVLITANLTPNVGPAVQVGGELRSGPFSFGLDLRSVLPSRVEVGPAANPDRWDLSQYVALAVPCGRYRYFFGCVVGGAGFQIGAVAGEIHTNPLLQLGGRLGAEIPFAANRLAVRGFGEVLYSQPSGDFRYVLDGMPKYTWTRPDVSAFFGVGLVVKLGNEETR